MALKIDFFESGVGETIRITFPDESIALVDAHPGTSGLRPGIAELIADQVVRFICLTHPHADHAEDIPAAIESSCSGTKAKDRPAFWHTLSDVQTFVYAIEEEKIPRSPLRQAIAKYRSRSASCLLAAYGAAARHRLPEHKLRSDLRAKTIAGVAVHVLGPDEGEQNLFTKAYRQIVEGHRKALPDPNHLSAILALEYGGSVVILGGDALKRNWHAAYGHWSRSGLAKAKLIKVPHHGAANAFDRGRGKKNWLDLCESTPPVAAVLMAGDSKHPHPDVADRLRGEDVEPICTANGLVAKSAARPAMLATPVLVPRRPASICNAQAGFEIDGEGVLRRVRGNDCASCPVGQ